MKYWAYVNNEILGPFEKEKLLELPSFSPSLLVCPQTPVGEKTEDWKEASSYPELSGAPAAQQPAEAAAPAPSPAPDAQPAAEPETAQEPALETPAQSFKPLAAAQSLDPVPPASHEAEAGIAGIEINQFGKSAGAAEPQEQASVAQSSSGFDPMTLSQIVKRTGTGAAQETAPAGEGMALEPRPEQPAADSAETVPSPAAQAPAEAAFTPGGAPEVEHFASHAAAPVQTVTDTAGLQALIARLDELAQTSATRQDLETSINPVRLKLDQMGEVISSIKNSQFQHEVSDKLAYLESAIGEIKAALRSAPPAGAAAPLQEVKIERNSDTVFGSETPPREKAAEKAPQEERPAPKDEMADTGAAKKSNLSLALKKVARLVVTVALLAIVLLGAVIGLKNFGIFDATGFVPFPLPFVSAPEAAQPAEPAQPAAAPAEPGVEQPAAPAAQEAVLPPDPGPEIVYLARTYKSDPAGPSLENRVLDHAARAGGDVNAAGWSAKPSADGRYEAAAVIPSKTGELTYTFSVDRERKSVTPVDDGAKALFAAPKAPPKRAAARKPAAKKPAARAPRKAAPAKAASKPAPAGAAEETGEDSEYEYVYEEEEE